MSVVAKALGVSRSQLHARLAGRAEPRRRRRKVQDATVVPPITALVASRPTYGYRRITALLNRQLRAEEAAPVNHKRVYRIMQAHSLLLVCRHAVRPHPHDGKVVTLRSNLRSPSGSNRWRLDGSLLGRLRVRMLERRDHPRRLSHRRPRPGGHRRGRAVANAGISGADVQNMMLEAAESRFGGIRAPCPVEVLSDNGLAYTARDACVFARQLGLKPASCR